MQLANYINDLLYRYDCVIVPNFGGFITNKIGAKVNNSTNTFYPPMKQVSFNTHLKHNDGLLANYVASSENITFDQATENIAKNVDSWQTTLENSSIEIGSIGTLSLNSEKQFVFEPNITANFLTDSFGLSAVESSAIERYKEEVKPLNPVIEVENVREQKRIPAFVKYAATAAILLTLGVVSYKGFNQYNQNEILAKQQQQVEQKIQKATFLIDNPLPTINLSVTKEKNTKDYHIIAGAFQLEENAQKKVIELKNKGFNAEILGKNKWGLIQVSFGSYATDVEARKELQKIKTTESTDAWLLVDTLN